MNFREEIVDRLTFAQLAAGEDPLLLTRLRGEVKGLGNLELEAVAEHGYRLDLTGLVDVCFEQLNTRLGSSGAIRTGAMSKWLRPGHLFASLDSPPGQHRWPPLIS